MDTSNLKNIVVLKDLPSNLVEEAIVVLKENQKAPKLELIDKEVNKQAKGQNSKDGQNKEKSKDYIIKEAQMLIADYISKVENKNKKENKSISDLKSKYKRVKNFNYFLMACLLLSFLIQTIM